MNKSNNSKMLSRITNSIADSAENTITEVGKKMFLVFISDAEHG